MGRGFHVRFSMEQKQTEFDITSQQSLRKNISKSVVSALGKAGILFCLVAILAHLIFDPHTPSRLLPACTALLMFFACLYLTRKGRPILAAKLLLLAVIMISLLAATFNGGIMAPATIGVLAVISISSWLFEQKTSLLITVCCILATLGFLLLGYADLLPTLAPQAHPWTVWMVLSLYSIVIYISTINPNIILRKALKAQRESDQAFQAVFDQTDNLMGLLAPDGTLLNVNKPALDLINTTIEEVVGLPFAGTPWWQDNNDRHKLAEAISKASLGQKTHFQAKHTDPNGLELKFHVSISPFRNDENEIVYLIAEGHNINELIKAQEQLHHMQRLDSVGHLAGGIAHDFNNMLGGILGGAELLRSRINKRSADDDLLKMVDLIRDSGNRAASLTSQLLAFARKSEIKWGNFSLHESIERMRPLLRQTLPPNISIETILAAENAAISGDAKALENCMLNLAINSRDAMPDGGKLILSTQNILLDQNWCSNNPYRLKPGEYLRLSIEDTGTGIPPEIKDHIFDPFFTTKKEGEGTGIGLASVHGTIKSHGGAITVYSELNRGTIFHLYFPLSAGENAPHSDNTRKLKSLKGKSALVVDDEQVMQTITKGMLEELGVQVLAFTDGDEALQAMASYDGPLDFAMIDIILAGRRGTLVAQELLAKRPGVPVVLMSGFPKDADLASLPERQSAFLPKPFTMQELGAKLQELLD